jgi:hypothetical protein
MSDLSVPLEPRRLGFKPEETFLREVFQDDIARSIWLLVAAQHLTGEDLADWSLMLARSIRSREPKTPEKLFVLINELNSMIGGRDGSYVKGDYVHVKLFVERLFDAVIGKNPVTYTVEVPAARKS